jgi:NADPH:quinone reductase
MGFEEAATFPLAGHTAWHCLFERVKLQQGEDILIQAVGSGVGSFGLLMAKGVGARAVVTAGSDWKLAKAKELGADEVINYTTTPKFSQRVKELTGGRGVDVVIDPVGGKDRFTDSLRALATGGRAVVVGFTEGSIPEVRVNRLLLNNVDVVGAGWGAYVLPRPRAEREIGDAVTKLAEDGQVRPLVGARFPLERGADALRLIDERGALGKLVLDVR